MTDDKIPLEDFIMELIKNFQYWKEAYIYEYSVEVQDDAKELEVEMDELREYAKEHYL